MRDIHRDGLERLTTRERQQPARDVDATIARPDRRLDVLLGQVRVDLILQGAQVSHHHGQQVVEVVGQPPRELADRGHFLGLAQGALRLLCGRDVEAEHEDAQDLSVFGDLWNEHVLGDQDLTVAGRVSVVEGSAPPGECRREIGT